MVGKPIISLFAPGIRTDLWLKLYSSLMGNTVPFELILVGNRQPNFELPRNFRFIYSPVKPAQCLEIGARYAVGELLMEVADDLVFKNGDALDKIYALYKNLNNDKTLIAPRWFTGGKEMTGTAGILDVWPCSLGFVIKRELWKELGGIDRRFIATVSDFDIELRVRALGGNIIICRDAIVEETHVGLGPLGSLWTEYGVHDDSLLHSLWVKDGVVKDRLSPVEPFTDDNILLISQGNKGRWV